MSLILDSRPAAPDFAAVKRRQQATWASGDFAVIGTTLQMVGELLAEAVDVRAGERVLDVAAGNGNATLAAARRIGLANWTPEGFIGRLFKVIGAHVPPPAGVKSPALRGPEPHIVELFGSRAAQIRCARRQFSFRYRSAAHWIQVFRDFYGPAHKAFAALDAQARPALERDIAALLEELNTAGPASLVVPGEYLGIVITTG